MTKSQNWKKNLFKRGQMYNLCYLGGERNVISYSFTGINYSVWSGRLQQIDPAAYPKLELNLFFSIYFFFIMTMELLILINLNSNLFSINFFFITTMELLNVLSIYSISIYSISIYLQFFTTMELLKLSTKLKLGQTAASIQTNWLLVCQEFKTFAK